MLELQVVESKFRRNEDIGVADKQLRRTTSLFESALAPVVADEDAPNDSTFWRRELATALDETSRRHIPLHDLPPLRFYGSADENLVSRLRERLLVGDYELRVPASRALSRPRTGRGCGADNARRLPLLRMPRPEILRVLGEIDAVRSHGERTSAESRVLSSADSSDRWRRSRRAMSKARRGKPLPSAAASEDAWRRRQGRSNRAVAAGANGQGMATSTLEERYQRVLDTLHEFGIGVEAPESFPIRPRTGLLLAACRARAGVTADKLMSRTTDLKLRLGCAGRR